MTYEDPLRDRRDLWLRAALGGDREAFGHLVATLLPAGLRLAVGMLQDPTEAEDAVQEAALLAWRRLATFRNDGDLRTWFLAIVANRCRTIRRGRWWTTLRSAEPRDPNAAAANQTAYCRATP